MGFLQEGKSHFDILTDFAMFGAVIFETLAVSTIFVFRRRLPHAERPYKAVGYPVLPGIYILLALYIDIVLLRYQPQYTWPGLIIVLIGIPVYYAWSGRAELAAPHSAS